MAENGELFVARMDDAQTFLIAGEIAPPAGVNEKRGAEVVNLAVRRTGFDAHAGGGGSEALDGPTLARVGARIAGVPEQDVIEARAFDVDCLRLAVEPAVAEDETGADGIVAQLKPRGEFPQETGRLQFGQHAHFPEEGMIAGQQRLADVETRKDFLFEDEHALAGARQVCRGAAAAGTATDDYHVVTV